MSRSRFLVSLLIFSTLLFAFGCDKGPAQKSIVLEGIQLKLPEKWQFVSDMRSAENAARKLTFNMDDQSQFVINMLHSQSEEATPLTLDVYSARYLSMRYPIFSPEDNPQINRVAVVGAGYEGVKIEIKTGTPAVLKEVLIIYSVGDESAPAYAVFNITGEAGLSNEQYIDEVLKSLRLPN